MIQWNLIMVIVQTTYHNYFERSNIDKNLW
jgi:hypothetical protein